MCLKPHKKRVSLYKKKKFLLKKNLFFSLYSGKEDRGH